MDSTGPGRQANNRRNCWALLQDRSNKTVVRSRQAKRLHDYLSYSQTTSMCRSMPDSLS
ncbi:hypothetical protein CaCOL14_008132 [Colletotrichum acutatum]